MAIIAKLYVDDKVFNVLRYNYVFNQGSDVTGRPSQRTVFKGLVLTLETQKDTNFYEWMLAKNLTKNIELHLEPAVIGGRIRKIRLFDAHLINLNTNFSSTGGEPLSETLTISAAGFDDSFSAGEYTASWRVSFPQEETATNTVDESPELIDYYITDMEGNEIEKYFTSDKIILNLETKNAIGENLTVSIPDKEHDFKHNGVTLQNDTIKDYLINNDLEQIELEVIEEEKEI